MSTLRLLTAMLVVSIATGSAAVAESPDPKPAPASATEIRLKDASIQIGYSGNTDGLDTTELRRWIQSVAEAVELYYGRFPVRRLRIQVEVLEGRGVRSGTTYGHYGALIRIGVGRASDREDFARDWIMTHEMVHLALPELGDRHVWLEEGLATYVEPIARAQAGQLTEEKVWRDMIEGMPHGLPAANDRGLDNTHTWGRTYWGGALFCLLADVRIREHTGNNLGLQDALRAIVASGGNNESRWEIKRVFAIGDKATGTQVLSELYDEMRESPASPDLADLWQRLGVRMVAGHAEFDDSAPLAAIRKAITTRRTPA